MPNSAESFDLNNQSRMADATPAIPTSTSEVAVRTMASDLEMMGKSGGMIGQAPPAPMQVPVALHPETAAPQMAGQPAPAAGQPAAVPAPASSGRGKMILITTIVILAALGLFALGYFVIGR